MEQIAKYLVDDGIVMIAVLYIIGETIKRMDVIKHRFIPPVLMVISVILTPLLMGGYSPENIVQSILVTGGATLYYETKKESIQNKGGD